MKPGRLRIVPDEYHFPYVGRLRDGTQFLAYVTGAFPGTGFPSASEKWQEMKRWIAVLHLFASDGAYLKSETRLGGYDADGDIAHERAWSGLQELFTSHDRGEPIVSDISVSLFSLEIDGVVHGLIYEADAEDPQDEGWVMLEPRDIMFHPPWDSGEYSS